MQQKCEFHFTNAILKLWNRISHIMRTPSQLTILLSLIVYKCLKVFRANQSTHKGEQGTMLFFRNTTKATASQTVSLINVA